MIKSRELSDAQSCMSRARAQEMTFVLLARDVAAPIVVWAWCIVRVVLRKNHWRDEQIKNALACARVMREQRQIKVFSMNDCDWVAALTLNQAKCFYRSYISGVDGRCDRDEEELFSDPCEVSPDSMDKMTFSDDEGSERVTRSFREQLDLMISNREKFPAFFATTEY